MAHLVFSRLLVLAGSALALTACAAGPDFTPPEDPAVTSYGPRGVPVITETAETELGGLQRFAPGGPVPSDWWRLFGSAPLSHLMDQAIAANPSLEAARAALRAAQETAAASYGGFFPSISGSASDNRSKASGSDKPMTLYNTSVSVSYAPDVFGGTRRAAESQDAKAEKQRFELEAALLTLTANVAATSVQEASLRGQIDATKEIIAAQKKQLDLIEARYEAGAIAKTTLLAQKSALAASKASLPPLEKSLFETRSLLAVLAGRFPSEDIGASFDLSGFTLPEELPVSLPSQLVKQRPDIRAALADLKAANADIGVAMAAMLPQFTLTGSYGVAAAQMVDLFSPTTALWGLGAGILQPLFKGGALMHQKRASEALFDQAAATYRSVVLDAFKNVADALAALESDAQSLALQLAAEQAAAETLELTTQQFDVGAADYIALLSAQADYQQSKIALIKAKAARLANTAALYQALGGGWWNRKETNENERDD